MSGDSDVLIVGSGIMRAVVARYNEAVGSGIQGLYTGAATIEHDVEHVSELPLGVHAATAFGQDADAMPAAALAWNAGGMGIHWTAAAPWPGDDEAFAARTVLAEHREEALA